MALAASRMSPTWPMGLYLLFVLDLFATCASACLRFRPANIRGLHCQVALAPCPWNIHKETQQEAPAATTPAAEAGGLSAVGLVNLVGFA